jgi:hypothetical protein
VTQERPAEFSCERAGIAFIIETHVVDTDTGGAKRFRKVAHRRENQDDLLLMMPHVGRFLVHLNHENDIAVAIDVAQGAY